MYAVSDAHSQRQFLITLAACGQLLLELSNGAFAISVSAGPHGVWLNRLMAKPVSENLLLANPDAAVCSSTATLPEGGEWFFSVLPESGTVSRSLSSIEIHGIQLGPESAPIARENWLADDR